MSPNQPAVPGAGPRRNGSCGIGANVSSDVECASTTYRAVHAVISQRNCTFHYREEFALFLPHDPFQCGLGLVPGACHDEFVIFPGKEIEHDFQHRRMAGAQDGFGVSRTILKLQPHQHGFARFFQGGCHLRYISRRKRKSGGHRGAEFDKAAAGRYFRLLLIGYFEGIDSERGIAWRAADSLGLRGFLGVGLNQMPPDHSTISRTRRLIDVETHEAVFGWVLKLLAEKGLLKGKTVGVDGTSLEANAALRSIVRRDTGEGYQEFLTRLAQESGIATPTREQLAKLDRKRARKGSNEDWVNPHDPEASITKMKDGRTHLAYKAEHAVDLETGAVVAVTVAAGDAGDTATILETLPQAGEHIAEVACATNNEEVGERVHPEGPVEAVGDKGYHSNDTLTALADAEVRTYIRSSLLFGRPVRVGNTNL